MGIIFGVMFWLGILHLRAKKKNDFNKSWRQICIYAFPKKALEVFSEYEKKTDLEFEEDIEILRFLELGVDVKMIELSKNSIAVDTEEDIIKVLNVLNEK